MNFSTTALATAHSFTDEQLADLRARELANLGAAIRDLEQARASLRGVLLGSGFIVRVQGICVDYAVDSVTRKVTTDGTGQPHRVRRFTKEDAQRLASVTTNGNGITGEAVHVVEAIDKNLAELRGLVELMKA